MPSFEQFWLLYRTTAHFCVMHMLVLKKKTTSGQCVCNRWVAMWNLLCIHPARSLVSVHECMCMCSCIMYEVLRHSHVV